MGPGHGKAGRRQRGEHPELALDGVRRRQQGAWRLASQHPAAATRGQLVRRVGLAALELAHDQRATEVGNLPGEPFRETLLVDLVTFADGLRTLEGGLPCSHRRAPWYSALARR